VQANAAGAVVVALGGRQGDPWWQGRARWRNVDGMHEGWEARFLNQRARVQLAGRCQD
jgi:hypothetical protein